jgi:hypothetical protein
MSQSVLKSHQCWMMLISSALRDHLAEMERMQSAREVVREVCIILICHAMHTHMVS